MLTAKLKMPLPVWFTRSANPILVTSSEVTFPPTPTKVESLPSARMVGKLPPVRIIPDWLAALHRTFSVNGEYAIATAARNIYGSTVADRHAHLETLASHMNTMVCHLLGVVLSGRTPPWEMNDAPQASVLVLPLSFTR